jgi:beta-glucosidase
MKIALKPRVAGYFVLAAAACLASAVEVVARDHAPLGDWPRIVSPIRKNAAQEAKVRRIVAAMTLAQKIGQMTQAEIKSATPGQAREFYLGSVLDGGGSWPGMHKDAKAGEWAALGDRYYQASMSTDMKFPVPIIWGIDAVHGNNNVIGATLYPHNIGLGAAHDPVLIGQNSACHGQGGARHRHELGVCADARRGAGSTVGP